MRVVSKAQGANTAVETFTVPVDIVGKNDSVNIKIPCAVNTCAIKSGDELVLYVKAVAKEDKDKQVTAAVEPPAKKRKADWL